jgi:hypothetical protein
MRAECGAAQRIGSAAPVEWWHADTLSREQTYFLAGDLYIRW